MRISERELRQLESWRYLSIPLSPDTWAAVFTLTLKRVVTRDEALDAIQRINGPGNPEDGLQNIEHSSVNFWRSSPLPSKEDEA